MKADFIEFKADYKARDKVKFDTSAAIQKDSAEFKAFVKARDQKHSGSFGRIEKALAQPRQAKSS